LTIDPRPASPASSSATPRSIIIGPEPERSRIEEFDLFSIEEFDFFSEEAEPDLAKDAAEPAFFKEEAEADRCSDEVELDRFGDIGRRLK